MEGSRINLNLLGVKARTKNELYRLLTTEVNMYLPPQKKHPFISLEILFMAEKE